MNVALCEEVFDIVKKRFDKYEDTSRTYRFSRELHLRLSDCWYRIEYLGNFNFPEKPKSYYIQISQIGKYNTVENIEISTSNKLVIINRFKHFENDDELRDILVDQIIRSILYIEWITGRKKPLNIAEEIDLKDNANTLF